MSKIGPNEAERRRLRERRAHDEPEPVVSDPAAQAGHREYMRLYMRQRRAKLKAEPPEQ